MRERECLLFRILWKNNQSSIKNNPSGLTRHASPFVCITSKSMTYRDTAYLKKSSISHRKIALYKTEWMKLQPPFFLSVFLWQLLRWWFIRFNWLEKFNYHVWSNHWSTKFYLRETILFKFYLINFNHHQNDNLFKDIPIKLPNFRAASGDHKYIL